MQLNGIVFEDAGCWLADVPGLDLMVQGDSKEDAFNELKEVFSEEFPDVIATFDWLHELQGVFGVRFKKPGQILHVMIKRHRETVEEPLSRIASRAKGVDSELWKEIESGSRQSTAAQFFSMLDALGLDVIVSVKKRTD
ncbi:type II toxin-antitoxin system HicB family antitoxin [Pseudobacteriovorax antillogorgiicola]|uniref:Uncharacterized protein n=1 Tax=Pseudobacteriovorax antillogorgiicola TaxID=1513793 RepID=A0A1Y6CM32_9BACT|nr:hypothetical protein [Pseudobacteriovorax antillogorgiicola]TCS45399.1 hypothetical protein EDD56_12810 [Pseudobacteriovorax antillogorgiicola]SMF73875.1 hypothetical protein SAMN06296036_12810 [Pseudobacteriovorax antillogorgiicola]